MNTRRDFLAKLFTILPAATQYKRVWKALEGGSILQPEVAIINPAWKTAKYEVRFWITGDINAHFGPPPLTEFRQADWASEEEMNKKSVLDVYHYQPGVGIVKWKESKNS